MKIAIIGSGISGLTSAYLLAPKHDITVFEANDYIGGHTHTHQFNDGVKTQNVDSGFIVYNENTYPNFIKLMDKLGVETQPTSMGFSVKSERSGHEYAGNSLNSLFAKRSNLVNPTFYRMIFSILKFNKRARAEASSIDPLLSLGDYLAENNYSQEFIEQYIVPMGAAIWSSIPEKVLRMPALFFIKFFMNHGLLQITNRPQWRVIKGGSNSYIKKLTKGFEERIKVSTPVTGISRFEDHIEVSFNEGTDKVETFDAAILALHSNQALKILKDSTDREQEILGSLPYQGNEVIIHTDESILPKRKKAWASWNYFLDNDPESPVSLTYNMNILQTLDSPKEFCVTLNNPRHIDSDKVLKNLAYDHPIFTPEGIKNQTRKSEISGQNRTYFCGAYWRNGFHEDGVVSALEVCSHFGVSL